MGRFDKIMRVILGMSVRLFTKMTPSPELREALKSNMKGVIQSLAAAVQRSTICEARIMRLMTG